MNNIDNAIYHVVKIVHKNVVTLHIYTSPKRVTICNSFFGWLSHPKTHGSMLHNRLKQNPTNKKTGELNLKLNYIFGILYTNYIFGILYTNYIFGI